MSVQHVHAILDRSGSMTGKIDDVIGGLRANLKELRKQKQEEKDARIYISIKFFDDQQELALPTVELDSLSEETLTQVLQRYIPRGQTALRDALGDSLNYFMTQSKMEESSCKTMIYVMTDGYENASKNTNYASHKLKEMIEEAKTSCDIWVYYVGSNQDAVLEANKLGVDAGHAMNYAENAESNEAVFRSLAAVAQRSRTGEGSSSFTQLERSESMKERQ